MPDDARTHAELLKLARTLGCEPARLEGLLPASPEDLRALREGLSDGLFAAHRDGFERIAAVSERLPGPVAATMGQRVLGPQVSARAAALLSPEKAVELAGRVTPEFLTDVALSIEPRHVTHVVSRLPPDTVSETTRELAARWEWVVLGGFMSHLAPEGLRAAVSALDGEALIRVAYVAEAPSRLDDVVALLSDERLAEVAAAAERHGLQAELAEVVGHLTGAQRDRADAAL